MLIDIIAEEFIMSNSEIDVFKSPTRKLVAFFKKSRDQWKDKVMLAKKENKRLKNEIAYLKKSKDNYKSLALARQRELAALRQKKACIIDRPENDHVDSGGQEKKK